MADQMTWPVGLDAIKERYRCMLVKYLVQLNPRALDEACAIGNDALKAGIELEELIALHELALEQLGDAAKTRDRSAPLNEMLRVYAQAAQPDGRHEDSEAGLREQAQYFQLMMENANGVFWIADALTGELEYVSPAAEKVLGITEDALSINPIACYDLVHGDDREEFRRIFLDDFPPKNPLVLEYRLLHPQYGLRWLRARINPVTRPDGLISQVLGWVEDDTERHEMCEQLARAQEMALAGRLTGDVAHDFNNLLTVMKSFGSLVFDGLAEGTEANGHMEQVLEAADEAAKLTRQLEAYGRPQPMHPQRFDVTGLIDETSDTLERLLGEEVALAIEHGADALDVTMDTDAFRQVITILALNARDAMSEGGRITMRTNRMTLASAFFGQGDLEADEGEYACVRIGAGTIGTGEHASTDLFQPVSITGPVGHGMGFGLSTVHGLVKDAAGYVFAESNIADGVQFDLYLPLCDQIASRTRIDRLNGSKGRPLGSIATLPSKPAAREDCTVLLVEDEEHVRRPLVRYLGKQGYHVLQASCGEEAIKLCRDEDGGIDILVTDVVMPRMSGGELARHIVQAAPAVKVIYISGYTMDMITDRVIPGSDAVLMQKPFTLQELGDKVRDVAAQ